MPALRVMVAVVVFVGMAFGCGGGGSETCCKVCTNSVACGDSCIPKSEACHVGAGCACNG